MQIMPGHIDLCVTGDILDGFKIHTQQLHHGNKGMTAAMWCQYTDTLYTFHCSLKLMGEVRRIAGHIRLPHFPYELLIRIPQKLGAVLHHLRHRNRPIAVVGFGCTDGDAPLHPHDCLLDGNGGTVLCDVPRFQVPESAYP